jgi:diguanylate cyclase (GGDEF)-like protein
MTASRALSSLVVPLGALLAAYMAIPRLGDVPASLAGLKTYAPHIATVAGLALSAGFGRGRTFFALATLAIAYAGVRAYPGTSLYHATTIALPLVLAVLAWRREASILSQQGFSYAAGIFGCVVATGFVAVALPPGLTALLHETFVGGLSRPPLGQLALVATGVSALIAFAAWIYRREAVALALATATIAFALSAHAVRDHDTASLYIATAAIILTIAVLQDIFHMAFRDPLTGLMSRRALDEHLAALGRRYVIAMVDVDHFKRVNDTYGHDTGDQTLRLVARMLSRVRNGARAYRYGGEEFALLFRGRDIAEVHHQLEALREEIANYPFRLRSGARKNTGRRDRDRNRKDTGAGALKITVSIGVAQSGALNADPETVLAMADKALYRAKHRGRNTVCR